MKYNIDPADGDAAYLQLYKQLRRDIVTGAYPYGGKLPSKRLLAEETGVSVITVEHTLALLSDEGYIEPRERSGYYVCYTENDLFGAPETAAPPIPHGHGPAPDTDFPFSVLAKTMRRVLTEYGEALLDKSPGSGCLSLRESLSQYLARNRGIRAAPDQIVIGSGAEYLYGLVVEMLGRDRGYAIESPSYEKIEQVYRAKGVRCDLLPLARDGIESSALRKTKASILHITPYRSFPSGVTASAAKRHEYAAWAREHGAFIVEDDYDAEFASLTRQIETVFSLAPERVLYLNTFSRTVSPAFRVAYMVLPRRMLQSFRERVGFYSCTVPTFEQLVLAELLDSGDFERHINRVRRARRKQAEPGPEHPATSGRDRE